MRFAAPSVFVGAVLFASATAAQESFVLKAACIGGYANTVTEVAAAADGTISRRNYYNSGRGGREWQILGRDAARVKGWLKRVDATKHSRATVPTTVDRNPCSEGSSRPCHIVRRKGKVDYYACASQAVLQEMMDFNEWTGKPRAKGALDVMEQWTEAFLSADVDGLVKLYAPDALFMGTGSKDVVSGPAEIRSYFENAFRAQKPRDVTTALENMVLSEDIVLATGTSVSTSVVGGNPVPDRVTFLVARRNGQWLIVHFHASAMPN